ncbi:basic proline-rich protein-like [Passer montanus]|uniref:basic proline-rich protein-like n=1 Tax=Passer montanus TaxID=9160 RepID=UPI0019617B83|nr:basic proline-rich protein-like [Passer montanus]
MASGICHGSGIHGSSRDPPQIQGSTRASGIHLGFGDPPWLPRRPRGAPPVEAPSAIRSDPNLSHSSQLGASSGLGFLGNAPPPRGLWGAAHPGGIHLRGDPASEWASIPGHSRGICGHPSLGIPVGSVGIHPCGYSSPEGAPIPWHSSPEWASIPWAFGGHPPPWHSGSGWASTPLAFRLLRSPSQLLSVGRWPAQHSSPIPRRVSQNLGKFSMPGPAWAHRTPPGPSDNPRWSGAVGLSHRHPRWLSQPIPPRSSGISPSGGLPSLPIPRIPGSLLPAARWAPSKIPPGSDPRWAAGAGAERPFPSLPFPSLPFPSLPFPAGAPIPPGSRPGWESPGSGNGGSAPPRQAPERAGATGENGTREEG